MAKNLSNLLQKGNITPKERYLLIIQNDIERATTGKEHLTKGDIEVLQNWQAKTNNEVREWNKYNEGWKLSGRAGIDAEFVYAETKAEHYRKNILTTELASYPVYRERLNALQALKKIKVVDIKEAIEITNKQREQKLRNGVSFNYAVYKLALETLKDDYRQDLKKLYDSVEDDNECLDNEEIIANLFNGKDELTKEAKEKLAELVAERGYNKHTKEYQLFMYFAGIPIMEIAKKWAKEKGIKPSTKDYEWLDKIKEILEQYARDNQTTPQEIIKATCLKWLDEGLLIKDYTPIFNSKQKNAFSGDTKHQHDELFKEWLKAKNKARETLKTLADKGELKITTDETGQDRTLTGESVYSFKGDIKYFKKWSKWADEYTTGAGLIYADNDKEHTGDNLDRELLIAEKDKDGKPSIVSLFGRSIEKIEGQFNQHFFTETEKDGETYLEFKSDNIEEVFKTTRQSLIDGYAKLLAFQDIHKKLSKIYEIDLNFLIAPRIEQVCEFIDLHNTYLDNALKDALGFGLGIGLYKKPLKTSENFYIEREKIAPDINIMEDYGKKFYEIFSDEYNY